VLFFLLKFVWSR